MHLVRDPLPAARNRARLTVIGIGNPLRGDDAVGLIVAREVRAAATADIAVIELEGEPASLIAAWEGAGPTVVVDAVASGAPAGTVTVVDATDAPLPPSLSAASTHALGLGEAIELARVLDRLPKRLVVVGVEASEFAPGRPLTPAVAAAVPPATRAVLSSLGAGP